MLIKVFNEISKNDADTAGGKGASLGEMTQAGLPVPPGFVLLAGAFERFLEETDLNVEVDAIFKSINQHDIASVERASEIIQALVLNAQMPEDIKEAIESSFKKLNAEFVAVRSSATAEDSSSASWAGELESYLNTTEDSLLDAVKKCWASLFTPRAIFYRFEKEMHDDHVSVAVVIQKMVQSEVSGITFTVHPVTEDYDQMVIEAGYGLGEAIVGGMITPDTYVIDKSKCPSAAEAGKNQNVKCIEDKNISKQEMMIVRSMEGNEEKTVGIEKQKLQKISDEQIMELSKICIDIEKHYGFPCDIEWAMEKGIFYIVQSRPITTLVNIPLSIEKDIILSKFYTREYSLFYAWVWREANCKKNSEWLQTNVDEVIFLRPGSINSLEVWYSMLALNTFRKEIESRYAEDYSWFNRVSIAFNKNWKQLLPYFSKKEALALDEFKKFYTHWVAWWTPMAIMMQIPEIETMPQSIRDKAYNLRSETQEYSDMGDEIYFAFLEKHYPEMKEYSYVLTPEEIFSQNFPEKSILEKRKEGWFMLNNVFLHMSELESELKKRKFVLEMPDLKEGMLIGQIANKGKATGKIKVISSIDRLSDVEEGDVLVTIMTDPRYVPALKKVTAIITDEGGLTCHAAIVARELGRPCIIGTKIATQVLKDGDIVEVDAYNGIVRILSNYNIGHYCDYQRLFQWKGGGLPYLISDIFMGHYKTLDGLVILKDGIWTNFLPKKKIQETLNDGQERLSSIEEFEKYKNGFESYQKECVKFLDIVISKQDITRQELDTALEFFVKLFYYYSKTEFFYIDKAFEQSGNNEIIKRNLDSFDELKNGGRAFLNKLFLGGDSYIEKIIAILADKFSVETDDLKFYSMEELGLLLGGQKLEEDILSKRKNAFVFKTNKNKIETLFGDAAADIIENFLHETKSEKVEEKSGTVANKGKVKGKVFIIDADYKNFHKISEAIDRMNQNDILVADTTAPELMIACKKASAILTNQGGLMSHAAIVSRELGIPCIVGLGNITDIVKSGDIVEADADNGVVKILGKRNE